MSAPNVELVRHMQWWAVRMVADELRTRETGLPASPSLSDADASAVFWWLVDCAERLSPTGTLGCDHHDGGDDQ